MATFEVEFTQTITSRSENKQQSKKKADRFNTSGLTIDEEEREKFLFKNKKQR